MKIYERNVVRKKCINRKEKLRNFISFLFLFHMKTKSYIRTSINFQFSLIFFSLQIHSSV